MNEKKSELVSFRATPTFKRALKVAADSDKRSQSNFLEKLVLDYCEAHELSLTLSRPRPPKSAGRAKRLARVTP